MATGDTTVSKRGRKRATAAAAPKGARKSTRDLADLLGTTKETVNRWGKQGCPHEPPARPGQPALWDLRAVVDWLVAERERQVRDELLEAYAGAEDSNVSEAEARRRKAVADAVIAEHRAGEATGRLVPISDVVRELEEQLAAVRSGALALPDRVAVDVAAAGEAGEVREMLRAEVVGWLEEVSVDRRYADRLAELEAAEDHDDDDRD